MANNLQRPVVKAVLLLAIFPNGLVPESEN